MKTNLLAIILLTTSASAAPTGLAVSAPLQPARLQPASGLDMAHGLGERGSVRVQPDSADAWRLRFPKKPNGQPR